MSKTIEGRVERLEEKLHAKHTGKIIFAVEKFDTGMWELAIPGEEKRLISKAEFEEFRKQYAESDDTLISVGYRSSKEEEVI